MWQNFIPVVLGLLIIRFASGLLLKLIGIVLIGSAFILLAYQKGIGPFERNYLSIPELQIRFCKPDSPDYDEQICRCILTEIRADLYRRFSPAELQELEGNRLSGAYALNRSLKEREGPIQSCLQEAGAVEKLAEFKRSLFTYHGAWMESLGKVFSQLKEGASGLLDGIKEEKREIDERYSSGRFRLYTGQHPLA